MNTPHFKSKRLITDYGEVLTPKPIIDTMLELGKQKTERIDPRFLEPACGTGNSRREITKRLDNTLKGTSRNQ
jgi:type I restriction-modification system DNA methylase subunit